MASSGSDVSDRAAAAAATGSLLGSLRNPELASLSAAELVVRLHDNRRGSDFADVAIVLAERERRLVEAEAQIRRAGEREAQLQAEVGACERRSAEPGEILTANVRRPDHTADSVGDQLEGVEAQLVGAHASRASEVEVAPLDCTPSAVEAAAGVLAMLAEAAADLPRLSPLRTTAADALLAPALQREPECNEENEDSGNSDHGLAIVPLGYFADATISVASEDSDDYGRIPHLTESQMWEELNKLKAHVSAWESELNTADASGTPTTPAQEGKVVCQSEAEATVTKERLRAEITACKEKAHATEAGLWAEILARGNAIQDLEASKSRAEEAAQRQARAASMTEARLRDEIAACKREAAEAEASHRAEILARGNAAQRQARAASMTEAQLRDEIAACKREAAEAEASHRAEILARGNAAQRQARAASMTEAQLRDEIAACKREAAEAEASHRAEIKACEDRAAAAVAGLQEEMRKRDRLAGEVLAHMEDKLVALDGYHTAIQNGLRVGIQARDLTIQYLSGTGPSLGDEEIEAMGGAQQQDEQGVSGRQHTTDPAAAASSSRAQASGGQQ